MADWLQNCQEWDWQEWVWLQCVRFVKLSMMHDDDDWPNYGLWNEPEMVTGYTQDEAGLWFPFISSKSAFIFMTTFCLLQVGQRNSIDQKIAKKPLFICPLSIFEFQIPMTISGLYRVLLNWTSFIFVGHGHPVHLNFKFQMNIPISPASLAIKGHYHNFIFYFLILSC